MTECAVSHPLAQWPYFTIFRSGNYFYKYFISKIYIRTET